MHRRLIALTILTVFTAAPALAQREPPARVGRVSFVSGNLAFHTAGQAEWSAAAVNHSVATGASLWTDAESRAEIRIDPDTIDMASGTELDVAELDERVTRFSVPQGRIYIHLRRLVEGQSVEIDIPRGAVQLLETKFESHSLHQRVTFPKGFHWVTPLQAGLRQKSCGCTRKPLEMRAAAGRKLEDLPSCRALFQREWCAVVDKVPVDLDVVRYWDLAATEKTEFNDGAIPLALLSV